MGIADFFKALAQVVGWGLMILAFALYITFREYLEGLPRYIVIFGTLLILGLGLMLILYRNTSRVKVAKQQGEAEKIVHISPMDELKHDVLALLTFGIVLLWVTFTGNTINGTDLAQATIAYLAVMLVRKIYRERYY